MHTGCSGKGGMKTDRMEKLSAHYMLIALQNYFQRRNPDQAKLIREICSEAGQALKVDQLDGISVLTGGIGLLRDLDDYFLERESKITS